MNVVLRKEEEDLLWKGLKFGFRLSNIEAAKSCLVANLVVQIGTSQTVQDKVAEVIKNVHIPRMHHSDEEPARQILFGQ